MNLLEIPLQQLRKAPWNYKTDDARLLSKLVANIGRIGQVENLIVRELGNDLYEVVNGNHRLDALHELGATIAVCHNLGVISEATAKRIAIETNETKFDADEFALMEIVRQIVDEFSVEEIAKTTRYSEDEIRIYQNMFAFDWASVEKPLPKVEAPEPIEPTTSQPSKAPGIYCPHCHRPVDVTEG